MKQVLQKIIKKYRWAIVIIVLFIMVHMYIATLPTKLIGMIIDQFGNNNELATTYIWYLLGAAFLFLLTRIPWRTLVTYIARCFEKDIKESIFDQFIKMKMTDLENIKNGELMSYFTKDVTELRGCFYRLLTFGFRILAIAVIGTYTMIANVDLKLTCVVMIPIVFTTFLIIKIKKYVEENFKKSQQYFTELSEYVQESTDSIRTIKAYAGEMSQSKTFIHKNKKLKQSNVAVDVNTTLLSVCINIGFGLSYGIALIYGSYLVSQGVISLGDFTAFNGYIALFYGPVTWLPGVISHYKRAQISYHRLDKLFHLEREKINLKNIEKQEEIKGDIVIRNLSYHYPSSIEVVLKNIDLTIPQGQALGIVGMVGSGKTTLVDLLLKLYPIPDGKIFIGGKDLNKIPTEIIRNNICYITQDNFLFSSTLRENISLFKAGYEEQDILESTEKAIMKGEIDHMNNGIDTIIGERGVDLSGGQKQRVVISRAFLQQSNIVIFDDTFSALDNRTEEKVLENVRQMTKGKTCIIISNRISDVKQANQIIVLEEGNIIQRGTHETLSQEKGLYQKFYEQQSSKEETFA